MNTIGEFTQVEMESTLCRVKYESASLHDKIKELGANGKSIDDNVKEYFVSIGMIDRIMNDLESVKKKLIEEVID